MATAPPRHITTTIPTTTHQLLFQIILFIVIWLIIFLSIRRFNGRHINCQMAIFYFFIYATSIIDIFLRKFKCISAWQSFIIWRADGQVHRLLRLLPHLTRILLIHLMINRLQQLIWLFNVSGKRFAVVFFIDYFYLFKDLIVGIANLIHLRTILTFLLDSLRARFWSQLNRYDRLSCLTCWNVCVLQGSSLTRLKAFDFI